jgi:hypothetical protein
MTLRKITSRPAHSVILGPIHVGLYAEQSPHRRTARYAAKTRTREICQDVRTDRRSRPAMGAPVFHAAYWSGRHTAHGR